MILGVEAVHTWETGLVLNERGTMPFYRVRRISGAGALPELEPETDPALGRLGEVPRESDRLGKTITYEGEVVASTLGEMREAIGDLVAAFGDTDEKRMDVEAHTGYGGSDLLSRFFHARPLSCEVEDEQGSVSPFRPSHGYERPFSIALRLSDPRFYDPSGVDEESATFGADEGLPLPFSPPGYMSSASNNSVSLALTNEGNAPVDAVFYMHGPMRNPVLSRPGTGLFLRFKKLVIASGDYVKVDFRRRRAVRQNANNVRNTIDPASTWWDRNENCLEPGANTVRMRAYSIASPAKLRATYNHGDYA